MSLKERNIMFIAVTTVLCHENEEEKENKCLRHSIQDIGMPLICNRSQGIILGESNQNISSCCHP